MEQKKLDIFDTTLRDGSQGEKLSFSIEDKLRITARLDELGVAFIEGGWPGSGPKDSLYFKRVRDLNLKNSKIVAFGSTRKKGVSAQNDISMKALIEAGTSCVSIFGKSWVLHLEKVLGISPEENLNLIEESVAFAKKAGRYVIYDAEHFFDGFKDCADYALEAVKAAEQGGADVVVLCDTNGGSMPDRIASTVQRIAEETSVNIGIHAHNDCDLAVANSIAAVESGVVHIQGTVNGYGERCGNANLCSVIPILQHKMNYSCIPEENLAHLKSLSHFVSEVSNRSHMSSMPFVGESAFAHKGGVHVNAVMKIPESYEHIEPEVVGNKRRVLISDLSGKSNILYKAQELGFELDEKKDDIPEIVSALKNLENDGYMFEAAEASLELLINRLSGRNREFFSLSGFRILLEKETENTNRAEATIRLNVDGETVHIAVEGNGPVHALDRAIRKALNSFYPAISQIELSDFKVRILNGERGTAAGIRVLIRFDSPFGSYGTVGVSENIIEASWQALLDGYSYFLTKTVTAGNAGDNAAQNPVLADLKSYA